MRKSTEIISLIFACAAFLLIGIAVYLHFRWGGMGPQAERGLLGKGLPIFGVFVLWKLYRMWNLPRDD